MGPARCAAALAAVLAVALPSAARADAVPAGRLTFATSAGRRTVALSARSVRAPVRLDADGPGFVRSLRARVGGDGERRALHPA